MELSETDIKTIKTMIELCLTNHGNIFIKNNKGENIGRLAGVIVELENNINRQIKK